MNFAERKRRFEALNHAFMHAMNSGRYPSTDPITEALGNLLNTPADTFADVIFKLETSIGDIDSVCTELGDYASLALLKRALVALQAGSVATARRLVDKALDGDAELEFVYEGAAAALADLQRLSA